MRTIIWLTGQPGTGKTTIAQSLKRHFDKLRFNTVILDGDTLRRISSNFDYSEQGRRKNVKYAQRAASGAPDRFQIVIVAVVAPYRDQREHFKNTQGVLECYIHRKISSRPEFHVADYQPPLENFVDLDTDVLSIMECTDRVLFRLFLPHCK